MSFENALFSISPLDGRYASQTEKLRDYFSEYALFRFRFFVEVQWFSYLLEHADKLGIPAPPSIEALAKFFENFTEKDAQEIKQIEAVCKHDVKAVEYYLKKRLEEIPALAPYVEWVHFGCTSEDINNLAYALMVKSALHDVLYPQLHMILDLLTKAAHDYAMIPMLSRTHGQPATPTTVGKELANVVYRLQRLLKRLEACEVLAKFNGAVGNYNAHHITFPSVDWPAFNQTFIERLGLTWNPYTTQIEPHDWVAEVLTSLSLTHTVLIDLARDIWSYISLDYFSQQANANEVGSSTMPHKINPIDFENAEGNLRLSQALAKFLADQLPQSRFQRDLVDSTLMRNVGSVFAYALIAYQSLLKGLGKIKPNEAVIKKDLANHPEVLAEAIQTVMRAHHLHAPYEQLKVLTRGRTASVDELKHFIQQQDLPSDVKERLLALTPESYIGYAAELAKKLG